MPRYIALLRGINVGGHRVKMDHLRALFEALRFTDVSTFIASGNVIFSSPSAEAVEIEEKIEAHLGRALGYGVDTFLRTPEELAAVADFRPFAPEDAEAVGHSLYVAFLREPLGEEAVRKLMSLRTTFDDFRVDGREFYWLRRGRLTDSLVKDKDLAKAVGKSSTLRNVTTVRKLAAAYPAESSGT